MDTLLMTYREMMLADKVYMNAVLHHEWQIILELVSLRFFVSHYVYREEIIYLLTKFTKERAWTCSVAGSLISCQ